MPCTYHEFEFVSGNALEPLSGLVMDGFPIPESLEVMASKPVRKECIFQPVIKVHISVDSGFWDFPVFWRCSMHGFASRIHWTICLPFLPVGLPGVAYFEYVTVAMW